MVLLFVRMSLSFSWARSLQLSKVNLQISDGEFVAIVGQSGSEIALTKLLTVCMNQILAEFLLIFGHRQG